MLALVVAVVFLIALLPSSPESYSFLPALSSSYYTKASHKWPTLQDRMNVSERSWQKSVELRHRMAVAHPNNPQIPFFPTDFLKYPYTLWDFFPPTWTCPHDIQRVGRLGDGGKWVCGMSVYETIAAPTPSSPAVRAETRKENIGTPSLVIYSFGINGESSFEADMLTRLPTAQIWGYDFSVNGWGPQIPLSARPRTFFKKAGLGNADERQRSPPFFTLPTLMALNNHTYIDILKIDIEGSEYTALDAVMDFFENKNDGILPFGQVMIELHVGDDQSVDFGRFRKWWERLENMGMRPAWMEINLMAVTLGSQKSDPRCTEYVWVNAKDRRNVLWKE